MVAAAAVTTAAGALEEARAAAAACVVGAGCVAGAAGCPCLPLVDDFVVCCVVCPRAETAPITEMPMAMTHDVRQRVRQGEGIDYILTGTVRRLNRNPGKDGW